MKITFRGIIDAVGNKIAREKSDGSTFNKRSIEVREISGKRYPDVYEIECFDDAADAFTSSDIGRQIELTAYLNGRRGSGKYAERVFMSLKYAEHTLLSDAPAQDSDASSSFESFDDDEQLPW